MAFADYMQFVVQRTPVTIEGHYIGFHIYFIQNMKSSHVQTDMINR